MRNLTEAEKRAYLEVSESVYDREMERIEQEVSEMIERIGNKELAFELDSKIGELVLAHEYKGYCIGLSRDGSSE